MSAVITPFEGTELFNTASFNNRISQINTGFSYVSNPNLLDNWYFGRPVNQRGQTEYTGEWIYTIDRWELSDGGGTLTVQDGSIIYASASYLFQPIDSDISKQLAGKTLTISFLYADGTLDIGTSKIASSWDSWTVFLDAGNARLVGVGNGRLWVLNTKAGKAIVAAKLELGPTQTLVHREGDKWVINEVPEHGEQLRECQRYHLLLPGLYWLPQNADGTNRLTIPIPDMRTIPVVTYEPADGSTGTLYYDANLAQKNSIQFYATGVTGICGVKNIRISADL